MFNIHNKWGLKQQVLLLVLAPTITISLLLGVYFTSIRLDDLIKALHYRGSAVTSQLSSQSEYGIFVKDIEALRRLARKALTEEISSIAFFNKNGKELASAGKLSSNITPKFEYLEQIQIIENTEANTISFIAPVTLPEIIIDDNLNFQKSNNELKATIIGWIKIELERKITRSKELQTLIHSILIVAFGLGLSTLLALKMGHNVTRPILKLTNAVEKIKQGKLDTRIKTKAHWELQTLESGINTMTSSLQSAHNELQKKINQATADLRNTLETIEVQNVELNLARTTAEAASKSKSEFLASMSHELRTPLNGIIGFLNLLNNTELSEQQKDYLKTIQKSSSNLLSIINDTLDFSKIEAGKLRLDLEPMNVRSCVEDALTLLAPLAHEKAIEIIPFIYSDVPKNIIGDSLRIKQVITNLVSNSIKFTENGSITVRVMLEREDLDNKVVICISVADTGIGLNEKQKKELFHAFNQADPNITRRFGGTGLGLVICKKLVEQMNGFIELESAPNQGSNFWFTIEAQKIENLESLENLENNKYNSHSQNINTKNNAYHSLSKLKILLCEKNPTARLALMHLINSWEIKITEAENIDEVIDITTNINNTNNKIKSFDLIILSINQPQLCKPPLYETICQLKKISNTPIGVLVNTTYHKTHEQIINSGAIMCLAKPVCRKKLYNALTKISNTQNNKTETIARSKPTTINVLAVDDNEANLKLATALLKQIGVKATAVLTGKEALNLIEEQHFSLILMDINMPELNGIETAKIIRQSNSINNNTPIVALSAHILASDREELFKAKINDYLTKPIDKYQLQAAIYKWTDQEIITTPKIESIDWDLGIRLAGGNKQLATEMLNGLIKTLTITKQEIKELYNNKKWPELTNAIHKLHGACCYVGVPQLKHFAHKLENFLANNKYNFLDDIINNISQEIDNLLEYSENT